ncbi:hypothetical protein G7Y89_g4165 [Cudoniella acicularis]|uniref:Uncharacterized protein n=1 Tax=Cudoniella acicularis TaxID=354080 RepID=A0A8H4W593_9HELO|nr:hypothetical protein G7Y89_g4165 [Cudoniella acicularis]
MEQIANIAFKYNTFDKFRLGFLSSVSYYINKVAPNLKEVVVQFHIIEPMLRTIAMEYWKLDEPIMTEEKSQEILAPMKKIAEDTLEGIRSAKLEKGEISRVAFDFVTEGK